MSSLAIGFFAWMLKRATSAQGETTLGSEVPGGKCPKQLGLNEEVQKSSTAITLDSPEQASDALSTLEGVAQDASKEACVSSEDGTLAEGPPNTDKVVGKAPSIETTIGPTLPARWSNLIIACPRRIRGRDKLVLNSPIKPMKWDHLSTDTSISGPDSAQSTIDR